MDEEITKRGILHKEENADVVADVIEEYGEGFITAEGEGKPDGQCSELSRLRELAL